MKKTAIIIIIILAVVAITVTIILKTYKPRAAENNNKAINEEQSLDAGGAAQITNPASAYCVEVGGKLNIQQRADGGEYGLCYFEDNQACEEWALLRGDCPVGGRKTTGLDSIDQKYCVWVGGETSAATQSVCVFKDGSQCLTSDFYKGGCPI